MTGSMRRWHRSFIIRTSSPSHNLMYVLHDLLADDCLSLCRAATYSALGVQHAVQKMAASAFRGNLCLKALAYISTQGC